MKYDDILVRQFMREHASEVCDILRDAPHVSFTSMGSALCKEVRLPISAEAYILLEHANARYHVNVTVGGGKDRIIHNAYACNSDLSIGGKTIKEVHENHSRAAAVAEHLLEGMKRELLEYLAAKARNQIKTLKMTN